MTATEFLIFALGLYSGLLLIPAVMCVFIYAAGRLMGAQATMVMAGGFLWVRTEETWRRFRNGFILKPFFSVGMNPAPGSSPRSLISILMLSPISASLLAGGLFVAQSMLSPESTLRYFCLGTMSTSLLYLVLMMIPYHSRGVPTIGMVLLRSREPEYVQRMVDETEMIRLMRSPLRPKEYPRELVERTLASISTNSSDLWRIIVAYGHFWDAGEHDRALEILQSGRELAMKANVLPFNVRSFWMEFAFSHAMILRDLEAANDAFARADRIPGHAADPSKFRALAAVRMLEGDFVAARDAIDRARSDLSKVYGADSDRLKAGLATLEGMERECLQGAAESR